MRFATTIVALALLGSVPAAVAQDSAGPYVSLECADLGDQTPKFASRDACYEKAAANKKMLANLKNVMRADIHAEDGNLMARNYKHVIMAYAALWILAVVFLFLLFMRQRTLTAEIARLNIELDKALADEEEE